MWGPRGYYKAPFYTEAVAVFVSEIGYHGCPNRESLEKMMDKKYVYPWDKKGNFNKQWQAKAVMPYANAPIEINRNKLMTKQATILFGDYPRDLDDFIFASQVVQAEAKKYFIEMWRSQKFEPKTGILWWNLRDAWPILSDAIVDYYNSKKLAYHYIKRVQTDVCAMINDSFEVIVANDTSKKSTGKVRVIDVDSKKEVFSGKFEVAENSKTLVGKIEAPEGQGMFLIEYELEDGKKQLNHYMYGKPPFKLADYKKWFKALEL
jgi:beta-mannosidase